MAMVMGATRVIVRRIVVIGMAIAMVIVMVIGTATVAGTAMARHPVFPATTMVTVTGTDQDTDTAMAIGTVQRIIVRRIAVMATGMDTGQDMDITAMAMVGPAGIIPVDTAHFPFPIAGIPTSPASAGHW